MICRNTSDVLDHPYLNILYPHTGRPTTPGPQARLHLNPALRQIVNNGDSLGTTKH